jgi:methylated-DNA-protein-cysteine methyltransferase related protein
VLCLASGVGRYIRAMRASPTPVSSSHTTLGAGTYARIYAVVRRIPRGRVATYGQIAELAGLPGHARQVGYALHALPDGTTVPWHRVLNAAGGLSPRAVPGAELTQRQLLEREGVPFNLRGRVPLERVRWRGTRTPRRRGQ